MDRTSPSVLSLVSGATSGCVCFGDSGGAGGREGEREREREKGGGEREVNLCFIICLLNSMLVDSPPKIRARDQTSQKSRSCALSNNIYVY